MKVCSVLSLITFHGSCCYAFIHGSLDSVMETVRGDKNDNQSIFLSSVTPHLRILLPRKRPFDTHTCTQICTYIHFYSVEKLFLVSGYFFIFPASLLVLICSYYFILICIWWICKERNSRYWEGRAFPNPVAFLEPSLGVFGL